MDVDHQVRCASWGAVVALTGRVRACTCRAALGRRLQDSPAERQLACLAAPLTKHAAANIPAPSPPHLALPDRLKKIQELAPADVDAALTKLPSDVSADCVALLRRIFSIPPAARPTLADIMAVGGGGEGEGVGVVARAALCSRGNGLASRSRQAHLMTGSHGSCWLQPWCTSGPASPHRCWPSPPPHPAPQDPWFRQFLPDLSKLAVAQAREQQSVAEITRILQVGAGCGGRRSLGAVDWPAGGAERVQQRLPAGVVAANQVRGERYRPTHMWLVGTLQHTAPPANARCCAGGGPAEPAAHAAARRLCGGGAGGCAGRRDG